MSGRSADGSKGGAPRSDAAASTAPGWLGELEESVARAVARLAELAADNTRLTRRVGELEKRLARASEAASGPVAAAVRAPTGRAEAGALGDEAAGEGGDEAMGEAAAWLAERQEVRARIEQLSQRLRRLVDTAD